MIRSSLLALAMLSVPASAQQYDPWAGVDFSRVEAIANRSATSSPAPEIAILTPPEIAAPSVPVMPAGPDAYVYGEPTGRLDLLPSPKPLQRHLLNLAVRPVKRAPSVPVQAARLRIETAMKSPVYQDLSEIQPWGENHDGWFVGIRRMTPLYAEVSIADQTLTLYRNGKVDKVWPVSTGRSGYASTRGTFKVSFLSRNHKSSIYKNSPMPCAIFYNGGEALHATTELRNLGRPASHGCVRLEKANACALFDEVARLGEDVLTVSVN